MSGVADATPYRSNYVGNGSAVSFPYNFKIANAADLEVIEAGVTLVLNTDYSVTGVGVDGGGTVVRTVAPINGAIGSILRKQPLNMLSVYTPNEDFPSVRVANDLEKLTMEVQFLAEKIARALKFKKASLLSEQDVDDPTVGLFARAKVGGGIDWASVVSAGSVSIPVSIAQGGTGGTTIPTARTNLLLSSQVTIAAAAALPVTQDSYQVVTGNTGITSLATQPAGTIVVLRFTGTPIITHNAASLILIEGVNYTAVVGDVLEFISEGAGNWRQILRNNRAGGLKSTQVFTGSGTWNRPSGIRRVEIEVVGGGGGGGGVSQGVNRAAGGGSAGGYSRKLINVAAIASSTVTVGGGGAGGVAGNNVGTNGTASSWVDGTNTVTGGAGIGGTGSGGVGVVAGAVGGSGSGGDVNVNGGYGVNGDLGSNSSGGHGGASFFGGGGRGGAGTEAGVSAVAYGSGGGGGADNNTAARAGGSGAPGIIIVREFE